MLLGKRLTMQEDRLRLRPRLQQQRMKRQMRGIVGTTRVLLRVGLRWVAEGLWCTTQPVWVLPRQRREARPVRPVRRLAGKRCEVVRVRWMRPRQQGWLQVQR